MPMKNIDEYISPGDFDKLVSHARCERDRVLVTLLYNSGRRISEVVGSMQAGDVSQNTSNLAFAIMKKKRFCQECKRIMKLSAGRWLCRDREKMWVDLGHLPETRPKIWIKTPESIVSMMRDFTKDMKPGMTVFPITRQRADQIIKRMGSDAGMLTFQHHKIHNHIFRHSFVVNEAKKCKDMWQLKKLQNHMQHSSIEMTSYYMEHFKEEEE